MPNSRHIAVISSPSRRRATKRRRSSITELSFHGIATSGLVNQAGGVTHVSGTKRHPCLGSVKTHSKSLPTSGTGLALNEAPRSGNADFPCNYFYDGSL